jgi:RNA polymerase sigma factor (sigma-70 family)
MNLHCQENVELWKQFKDGNQRASQIIYQIHYKKLINYGNKFVQDSELVKDVVQDLFLNLLIRKANLGEVDNIELYLKSSLRHDLFRKIIIVKKQMAFDEYLMDDYLIERHRIFHYHNTEEREGVFVRLDKEVEKLPKRLFLAVTMRYFRGMSNQEIADQMGINYQSATNHIYRGIETLRDVMNN